MTLPLRAEVVCRVPTAAEFARRVTAWFTEAVAELCPDLVRDLPTDDTAPRRLARPGQPYGTPGTVYGELEVRREPTPSGGRAAPYSPSAWRRLLAGLEPDHPFHIGLTLVPLDEDGWPITETAHVVVEVNRLAEHPDWVRFDLSAPPDLVAWPGSTQIQDSWVEFVRKWSIRFGACYAHVTDDADVRPGTALEQATFADIENTVPRCHDTLRGYSWVTVCAPELAERLGGPTTLTASGAFHTVAELPDGQLLLRATPLLEQYEGIAVTRVFQVLAPVLLPGRTTEPYAGFFNYLRVVLDVDAADF